MASTVVIVHGPTGLTGLKLELYAAGSDTIANTSGGDTLTEATNRHGHYQATVTQSLAGTYSAIIADSSGTGIGIFKVKLADDAGPYTCEEPSSVTDTSIAAAVWAFIGETGLSMLKIVRRILATTAGEEAGDSSSTTRKYLSPNESVTRVTATISGGRRSSVTYDDSDES